MKYAKSICRNMQAFFVNIFLKIKIFSDFEIILLHSITIVTLLHKQMNYANRNSKYRIKYTITRNVVILIAVLVYKYTRCRIGIKNESDIIELLGKRESNIEGT